MDNCFICLGENNLIRICKCNLFIHRECGNELNKYNNKCNICNYTYKYTQNLDIKHILLIYIKNIIDIIFAIYIAFSYIHIINKININIFVNIIIQLYVVVLIDLYICLLLLHILWKYIDCFNIIYNSFIHVSNIETYILLNRLYYNITDFFSDICSYSYTSSIIYLIYYYSITYINYLFIKTFNIRDGYKIIKKLFIKDINNRKINRIEPYNL